MPLAGQAVIQSGVYRATHAGHDDLDGDVALTRGQRFPRCSECNYGIYYTLMRAASGGAELCDLNSPRAHSKVSAA